MPRKPSTASPRARKTRAAPKAAAESTTRNRPAAAATPTAPPLEGASGAVLQAPLRLAAVWSDFAGQLQRANKQAWQGWQRDTEAATDEAQRAASPQQAAGLPLQFAVEQAARWTQLSTQMTASLLDVQTNWFKSIEALCTQWMTPLLAREGRIAFGSAQDLVEPPAQAGPAPIWWTAQRLWSESAKVWLNAMSHDLQSEPRGTLH
jgi:hypothetical protein